MDTILPLLSNSYNYLLITCRPVKALQSEAVMSRRHKHCNQSGIFTDSLHNHHRVLRKPKIEYFFRRPIHQKGTIMKTNMIRAPKKKAPFSMGGKSINHHACFTASRVCPRES